MPTGTLPHTTAHGVNIELMSVAPLASDATQTEPGTVLGTAAYMAPEQVRARPADHRSDIFSFGAILYEMRAGRRAFHRESSVETTKTCGRRS